MYKEPKYFYAFLNDTQRSKREKSKTHRKNEEKNKKELNANNKQ